jgi:glycosyltransferase involved in cell wall biosynthesis
MPPRILIQIGQHLCTAPRPMKEADALSAAGYDVTVVGIWFDDEKVRRDQDLLSNKLWSFHPVLDFRPDHGWARLCERLKGRVAREAYCRTGLITPPLFGYGASEHFRFARKFNADLTIVHSETGLWAGEHLLRSGRRVGVDFEDWFSEDLLPAGQLTRPVKRLKVLERTLLRQAAYRVTTSAALAEALAADARASAPAVIRNLFPWTDRRHLDGQLRDRSDRRGVSLHWFSQTLGPGRGLELLFAALPMLQGNVEVHLRGDGGYEWARGLLPATWQDRVFMHRTVPNEELLSRIAEHDIGLALEIPVNQNKDKTISNKIFQYLQGRLAVVATSTAGQREVFEQTPGIGLLMSENSSESLARAINDLLSEPARLSQCRGAALAAAEKVFNWENAADKVVELVTHALRAGV